MGTFWSCFTCSAISATMLGYVVPNWSKFGKLSNCDHQEKVNQGKIDFYLPSILTYIYFYLFASYKHIPLFLGLFWASTTFFMVLFITYFKLDTWYPFLYRYQWNFFCWNPHEGISVKNHSTSTPTLNLLNVGYRRIYDRA